MAAASFALDSYEFLWSGRPGVKVADIDDHKDPLIQYSPGQKGFQFTDDQGQVIAGPISSVLAVRLT